MTEFLIIRKSNPVDKVYLLKVNKTSSRARYEICSKLTIRCQNDGIGVVLVLTLDMLLPAGNLIDGR